MTTPHNSFERATVDTRTQNGLHFDVHDTARPPVAMTSSFLEDQRLHRTGVVSMTAGMEPEGHEQCMPWDMNSGCRGPNRHPVPLLSASAIS
jgi:hypothetical protein